MSWFTTTEDRLFRLLQLNAGTLKGLSIRAADLISVADSWRSFIANILNTLSLAELQLKAPFLRFDDGWYDLGWELSHFRRAHVGGRRLEWVVFASDSSLKPLASDLGSHCPMEHFRQSCIDRLLDQLLVEALAEYEEEQDDEDKESGWLEFEARFLVTT